MKLVRQSDGKEFKTVTLAKQEGDYRRILAKDGEGDSVLCVGMARNSSSQPFSGLYSSKDALEFYEVEREEVVIAEPAPKKRKKHGW